MTEFWNNIGSQVFNIFGGTGVVLWLLNFFKTRKSDKAEYTKKKMEIDKFYDELVEKFERKVGDEKAKLEAQSNKNQNAFQEVLIKYQEDINKLLAQIAEERRTHNFDLQQERTTNGTLRKMIEEQNDKITKLQSENQTLKDRIGALEKNIQNS